MITLQLTSDQVATLMGRLKTLATQSPEDGLLKELGRSLAGQISLQGKASLPELVYVVIGADGNHAKTDESALCFSLDDRKSAKLTALVMSQVVGVAYEVYLSLPVPGGVNWREAGDAQCVIYDFANGMREKVGHLL